MFSWSLFKQSRELKGLQGCFVIKIVIEKKKIHNLSVCPWHSQYFFYNEKKKKRKKKKKKQEIRKGFQTTFNCFKANNKSTIVKPEDQKGIRSSKPRLIEPVYLDRCHFHFVCTESAILYIESRAHAAIKLKTKNIHSPLWRCYEKQEGFLYMNRLSGVTIESTLMCRTLLITLLIASFFKRHYHRGSIFSQPRKTGFMPLLLYQKLTQQ